jgi:hypothetical protein
MSKLLQSHKEFSQARTLRARVWVVGVALVIYSAFWWFWSESVADNFAFGMAFLFAALWIRDGMARPWDHAAPENPEALTP